MKSKQTNQMKTQILFIYLRLILVEKGKHKNAKHLISLQIMALKVPGSKTNISSV